MFLSMEKQSEEIMLRTTDVDKRREGGGQWNQHDRAGG